MIPRRVDIGDHGVDAAVGIPHQRYAVAADGRVMADRLADAEQWLMGCGQIGPVHGRVHARRRARRRQQVLNLLQTRDALAPDAGRTQHQVADGAQIGQRHHHQQPCQPRGRVAMAAQQDVKGTDQHDRDMQKHQGHRISPLAAPVPRQLAARAGQSQSLPAPMRGNRPRRRKRWHGGPIRATLNT